MCENIKMSPRILNTNADTAFKSGEFAALMHEFVIQHKTVYIAYEAERSIKLIKEAVACTVSHKRNKTWIDKIHPLIDTLNKRVHRGTKMTPYQALENVDAARVNLNKYWGKINKKEPETFKVGDHVRLREEKGTFAKGHVKTFSHDVYKISHAFPPKDEFRSYHYGVEGIRDRVFTYNDLRKTSASVTVSTTGKAKLRKPDRLPKQAAKELQELDGRVVKHSPKARKPRGDIVTVEIPSCKRK